jgi:pimeloyl-ACP methyl ester carboxylesterase
MKSPKAIRAVLGVSLFGIGLFLAVKVPYHAQTFRIGAGGCRLVTDIVEPTAGAAPGSMPQGYVVLLHGLSANKRIMSYFTSAFASQGLRVFVPDLPGHGRTGGPFSYERSEQCSENLVRELIGRGLLDPEKTILVGHSLGGADALRVASRIPVSGVIAISPAPMRPIAGLPPETIPFHGFGALPSHSLVMNGAWEPQRIRNAAKDLVPIPGDGTSLYVLIPHATHVSLLFDGTAVSVAQKWAAQILRLKGQPAPPSHRGLLGSFAGFIGIMLLAGPFLREILQRKKDGALPVERLPAIGKGQALVEIGIVALGSVGLLSYWNPLRVLHLFEGAYFASFLLALGALLLALHWKDLAKFFQSGANSAGNGRPLYATLLIAGFAALLLQMLINSWFDLTISEAWLTPARWARFVPFFLAVLPYHAAEEMLLGPSLSGKGPVRLLTAMTFRVTAWGAIVAGIFLLHSSEVLLVLLAPYFGLFCLLQGWGMNVVRQITGSGAAAAFFGAILLAGFCLVVFPTT